MAYSLNAPKALAASGAASGGSLPVLGFHYLGLIVFSAALLFAGTALLTVAPRWRRVLARVRGRR